MVDVVTQSDLARRLAESLVKEGRAEETLDTLFPEISEVHKECENGNVAPQQQTLDELHAQRQALRKIAKELGSERQELSSVRQEVTALSEELRGAAQAPDDSLLIQKNLFSTFCGLEFRVTEERAVSFVFHNINPSDPSQKFSVTLDVQVEGEKSHWTLLAMMPRVQSVQMLMDSLNEDNNIHLFCRNLRQCFVEGCDSNSAQTAETN